MRVRRPAATVGRPAATVGRPAATVGRPAATVGRPAARLGRPAATVGRPAATVGSLAGKARGHLPVAGPWLWLGSAWRDRCQQNKRVCFTILKLEFSGNSFLHSKYLLK